MLTVIIAAIVTAIVILLAVMAWQPAFTPAGDESAPQRADGIDGIDGWDAARTSTVTAATFGIGSLAARVITTHDERVYDLYGKHENRRRNTMNKRQTFQYIAECLDPMDTAADWDSGDEFADAILENADDGTPLLVTRDDLIEYWQDAREQADSSDSYTITTNVNREFTAFGMVWRVDEDGDLMVILENGRSYVIDYVMEPTWTTWQDYDTIEDFAVTITREHVALAEEMRAEVIGDD